MDYVNTILKWQKNNNFVFLLLNVSRTFYSFCITVTVLVLLLELLPCALFLTWKALILSLVPGLLFMETFAQMGFCDMRSIIICSVLCLHFYRWTIFSCGIINMIKYYISLTWTLWFRKILRWPHWGLMCGQTVDMRMWSSPKTGS